MPPTSPIIWRASPRSGDYRALIVVAPPRTLAVLRKRFGRAVRERIVAEIGKDLTNHPVSEIAAILGRDGD